mgnify:CR=1 FL=1
MVELSKLTPAGIKTALVSSVADKLGVKIPGSTKIDDIKRKQKEAKNRLNKTMSGVGDDPSTGMSIEDMDTIQAGLKGKDVDKAEMQRLADKVSDIVDKSGPVGGSAVGSADSYTIGDTTYGDLGSQDDPGGSAGEVGEGTGYSEETLGGLFKQGGLAKRKTKVKKMKRGGLASKK